MKNILGGNDKYVLFIYISTPVVLVFVSVTGLVRYSSQTHSLKEFVILEREKREAALLASFINSSNIVKIC